MEWYAWWDDHYATGSKSCSMSMAHSVKVYENLSWCKSCYEHRTNCVSGVAIHRTTWIVWAVWSSVMGFIKVLFLVTGSILLVPFETERRLIAIITTDCECNSVNFLSNENMRYIRQLSKTVQKRWSTAWFCFSLNHKCMRKFLDGSAEGSFHSIKWAVCSLCNGNIGSF